LIGSFRFAIAPEKRDAKGCTGAESGEVSDQEQGGSHYVLHEHQELGLRVVLR